MTRKLVPVLVAPLFLCACPGGGSGDAKTACAAVTLPEAVATAPKDVLDLTHWSLTLPVDATGAHSGIADTISTSDLLGGYSSAWFESTSDGGVSFFAPIEGATTAHTIYPRSELREMLDPANTAVNWLASDTAELSALVTVYQAPSANGKVTLGEIVGYNRTDPDINVLTKLVYEQNGCVATLYTSTLPSPTASGSTATHQVLTRSLLPGHAFSYSIRVENHAITFTTGNATATEAIPTDWDGVGLYFRAGASLFATGSSLEDGARVSFQQLEVTHGV